MTSLDRPGIYNTNLTQIHGTLRQKDKIYREDIFYGKGKDLTEATRYDARVFNKPCPISCLLNPALKRINWFICMNQNSHSTDTLTSSDQGRTATLKHATMVSTIILSDRLCMFVSHLTCSIYGLSHVFSRRGVR